jgi:hypothetical protein
LKNKNHINRDKLTHTVIYPTINNYHPMSTINTIVCYHYCNICDIRYLYQPNNFRCYNNLLKNNDHQLLYQYPIYNKLRDNIPLTRYMNDKKEYHYKHPKGYHPTVMLIVIWRQNSTIEHLADLLNSVVCMISSGQELASINS